MKYFFFKSLYLCALLLFASGTSRAQIQESPLDTQILPVGQMFSLIIKGDGESDPPAGISAEGLPPESVFLRNLDGSRTFMWIPDSDDVGTNSFLVTITDGNDEQIFATYPINLEVIDSEAEAATIQNQAANAVETAEELAPVSQAAITDDQTTADITKAAKPVETPTQVSASYELPTATVVDIEDNDGANDSLVDATAAQELQEQSAEPVYPELLIPDEVTITVNNELSVPIRHSSESGNTTQLSAVNLPQGARLSETPSGHVLVWTPDIRNVGSTAVIITATDTVDTSLSTTRRLGIEVTR